MCVREREIERERERERISCWLSDMGKKGEVILNEKDVSWSAETQLPEIEKKISVEKFMEPCICSIFILGAAVSDRGEITVVNSLNEKNVYDCYFPLISSGSARHAHWPNETKICPHSVSNLCTGIYCRRAHLYLCN